MENTQNRTDTQIAPQGSVTHVQDDVALLKHGQQQWVTFLAAGQLVEHEDGRLEMMSISKFSELMNIPRRTLYDWKRTIPNFQQLVAKRQHEIFTSERIAKVWAGLYLKAKAGHAKQAEMVLSHFSDYVPPASKAVEEVGNALADLLQAARNRRQQNKKPVIDGEVVGGPTSPSNT